MQAAGYPAMNAAAPAALLRSLDWKWIVIGLCVVFTIYIAVVPLAFLLWQSFFTPQTAAKAAEFTLGNYTSAYGSSETLRLFWNSVQFAVGASVFAFVLGTALAWMNERTNTPFKTLFLDRKSTRLNSSHLVISYAVFCLKKKNKNNTTTSTERHSL